MKKELYDKIEKVYHKDFKSGNMFMEAFFVLLAAIFIFLTSVQSQYQIFYATIAIIIFILVFQLDVRLTKEEDGRRLDMDELFKEINS
jgi:di/tricarboxylate transporter